jgi:Transposase, Mutator family
MIGSCFAGADPQARATLHGIHDKIVAMYARGMTVREIHGLLSEQYGTEVSPEFISSVTDAVMAEVGAGRLGRWSRCTRWSSSTRCA